ncbi:MAG: helical backbone metal receptor [Chitinophagales bacterium]
MPLTNYPITAIDQLGFSFTLNQPPKSIVSLVPSITITLFDLGVAKSIIGRTKFCIHPKSTVKSISIIGGTKNLDIEKILSLQPDLILANKEENEKAQIEALKQHCNVYVSDVKDLYTNNEMIEQIGWLTNTYDRANQIINQINEVFKSITPFSKQKVAYFIWRQPYMVAGNNTFINHLLKRLNLVNVFENFEGRYPIINIDQLKQVSPDFIFLSSEPYPFKSKHIEELKSIVPNAKIVLVDGELFSWFGSKMIKTPSYIKTLYTMLTS